MACQATRVAIVDDERSILRGLDRLLRSMGFDVSTYASGAEFLDALKGGYPDCLVLDLHMPQMSGFDVQARLAQTGNTAPVIVITGHDTSEARSRAMRLGAKAYLCKPVDGAALLAAIRTSTGAGPEAKDTPR